MAVLTDILFVTLQDHTGSTLQVDDGSIRKCCFPVPPSFLNRILTLDEWRLAEAARDFEKWFDDTLFRLEEPALPTES